jgi:hypothetical protein
VALTVGVLDAGKYGHNYGSSLHKTELIVTFDGTTTDLVFSVTGYDIDWDDEIEVYLNFYLLGYLTKGPNNGLNTRDSFSIPVGTQFPGENQIRFVQKTPGWKWGVTNLMVADGS